ncbi:MAG: SagB/ThcOx family dehydrogenase [Gammaproteobacteria bacterium]|nr:SagB/ThcOx family dehydrogenase [Gammaproteobacteria bacterium]MCW5583352.1 SagB/ThcOx family dehydrogenase [Gammaproteobacteria bacterium]
MEKFFWFSLPITLMIIYLLFRAAINKPVSRRDINMISAIYLIFYLFITAGLGLFWVARMDLPAFDLHYLFGYCLLFLICVHLWFQLPLINFWLKKNSPSVLVDETYSQWKPLVKNIFLLIISAIIFPAVTLIVYEFISPATVSIIESKQKISTTNRLWLMAKGEKVTAASYMHKQGDLTRGGAFLPRFNIIKPPIYKTYPNHPIVPLPAPTNYADMSLDQALSQHISDLVADVSLQNLSNILYYSNGVTETRIYPGGQIQLRAAASAGALYPNDLYIAAISIKGLTPGIYYYHPANHSLIKIGDQALFPSLTTASLYPDLLKNTSAIIIMTAYFDRSVWKYHDRSYRYVLPDAGHILGNLAAAITAMKVSFINTEFFDDEKMEKILNLSPKNEGVISLVILGKKKLASVSQTPQFTSVALPKNTGKMEITRLSHKLTSVKWVPGPMKISTTITNKVSDDIPSSDKLIKLPEGSTAESDVFTIIKNRRSFRQFSDRDVSFNDFSGIIHDSFKPLKNLHLVEQGNRVALFIIVTHVQGLSKGIYQYIYEKSALQKIADGNFSNEIYKIGLSQEVLKRAAFVFAWVIDLNKIGLLHGERDYRYANLECGIGSSMAYLAAQSRDLGVCAVGAFYDDEVQRLLKIDGTAKHTIVLTAIGQK